MSSGPIYTLNLTIKKYRKSTLHRWTKENVKYENISMVSGDFQSDLGIHAPLGLVVEMVEKCVVFSPKERSSAEILKIV